MHLPDDRLLVSGQAANTRPSHFITGSIKHPEKDTFVSATAAVGASTAAAADGIGSGGGDKKGGKVKGSSSRSSRGGRRHRRGLNVRTLRRMLVVAGPEGQGVRRKAALIALGRSMAVSLGVVLIGGVLGWVVGGRGARAAEEQEQQEAAAAAAAAAEKKAKGVAKKERRQQRKAEGRRQSQSVDVAAVI